MEKQMKADREKRASILLAEGEKQAAITRAEGEKESAILRAEAVKQQRIREAEGEAQALLMVQKAKADSIRLINEAAPSQNMLALRRNTGRQIYGCCGFSHPAFLIRNSYDNSQNISSLFFRTCSYQNNRTVFKYILSL